jgi:hypothetical protein
VTLKASVRLVALGGICAALTACGGSPPPPAPPAPVKPPVAAAPTPAPARAPAPAPTAAAKPPAAQTPAAPVAAVRPGSPASGPALVPASPAVPTGDAPKYVDKGRKDPFSEVQITSSAGGLTVSSTKLTGIVRGPRATLALLETPDGIGYILKPGDTLGDGRLMEIGADNVVFAVGPKPGSPATRVVLRMAAN